MRIHLAYGKSGLEIDFPDKGVDVIEPEFIEGVADEKQAIARALRQPIGADPLKELVRPGDSVAIIFPDRTRPMPSDRVLPIILDELHQLPTESITLINAVGTHRTNTSEELEAMLGKEIVNGYRIVQHRPRDKESMVRLGVSRFGNEVWVNKDFMQAKVKILTGFIEPHFFAGFSGGPKAVLLGVGAFESILRNHSAPMIGNPRATWGITEGNPIYEEMSEIAAMVKPDFIVNVTLNRKRQITGVFAGHWHKAHAAGCAFARQVVMRPVAHPYDLVVTTNSGFPLDMNLYQAVKGMSAAEQIVKPGGTILMASECSDGVPDHGNFKELLRQGRTPQELMQIIHDFKEPILDQWEVQILARVLLKAEVYLYSTLPEEEVKAAHLKLCMNIGQLVRDLSERGSAGRSSQDPYRIAVLPEGPQTVPFLPVVAGKSV
ncbi:MAG: nickel-dependent lactate racemase [Terriglobia bacterium]